MTQPQPTSPPTLTAMAATNDPPALRPPAWTFLPRSLWPMLVWLGFALLLQFFIKQKIGDFLSTQLMFVGINVILAVSLTVVNGFTGQFSIGHAGFMSLGGYAAGSLVYYSSFKIFGDGGMHGGILSGADSSLITQGDLLFIGACIVGGLVAAGAGWLVGLPSLRLRGDYLAIVTLGFGEIVRAILQGTDNQLFGYTPDQIAVIRNTNFFREITMVGGALGLNSVPQYTTLFWIWLAVGITLVAVTRLKMSSYGRALLSVREDEIAAQATGVNITKYKVRAFVFGAFFAGVAGALSSMQIGSMLSSEMGFQKSFEIVIMVVLGGLGSISGAALAAVILTALQELLRDPPSIWPWGLVGAAVIAVLIYFFAHRKRGPLITLLAICAGWEAMRYLAHVTGIDLGKYRMILYSLLLIVMMIVRPQGLFGVQEIWDYLPASWKPKRVGRTANV